MQRFFTLVALFLFALPVGLSVTGCVTNVSQYCNNLGYGAKTGQVYSVRFAPGVSATGISLGYGQSTAVGAIMAEDCRGTKVGVGITTYGTSNLQLADISPLGSVCAGTWNRLSPGGIPDFSICTPPATHGVATITASTAGIVSNPITVYVHPPVSAITVNNPTGCVPSGQIGPNLLNETSVFDQNGNLMPSQGANNEIGVITYTANTPGIVTINNTNVTGTPATGALAGTSLGTTQANQPGGTVITATIAGTGGDSVGTSSAAGYFYTCPPTSIALSLLSSTGGTNPDGSITVTAGNPQTITAAITDNAPGHGNVTITPTTGNSPDYTSSLPQQVAVSATGAVSSALPGLATVTAICQPGAPTAATSTTSSATSSATGSSCNPTPLNKLGTFGTGLPIVANPLLVRSPGVNSTLLWAASPNSREFTPFDLSLGTGGAPILLPYPPNSMVLDPNGATLYFGSYRALMTYSALNNSPGTQDTTVPGVVLAVAPANNQVVIADQLRKIIYLYTPASGGTGSTSSTTSSSVISIGGVATHAEYSPDGKNVYIVGPDTLYVHNLVSGWSHYPLTGANATANCPLDNTNSNPFCSPDVAITVPAVAVFTSGAPVAARSFCPDTTTTPVTFNPVAATVNGGSADHLSATPDGMHLVGATTSGVSDITHGGGTGGLIAPVGPCPGVLPGTAGALAIQTTLRQIALTGITPTQIDQVLASPDSSKAFITYTANTASGLLPVYTPTTGQVSNVQLTAGALAPVAGAFSPDAASFFVSTTGDNLIHVLNSSTLKDTQQLNPQLTDGNGAAVPAQFIVTKGRPTT